MELEFRWAVPEDWERIAALHAASWKVAYRGILSDSYLDQEVDSERREKWQERLSKGMPERTAIVLAESAGQLEGFCSIVLDEHPEYGALVDNLHVQPQGKGRGWGRELLRRGAAWAEQERPGTPLHLYVYDANTGARAFYRRMGGLEAELQQRRSAAGIEADLWRIQWPSARSLVNP